jgi:hypothetical protein
MANSKKKRRSSLILLLIAILVLLGAYILLIKQKENNANVDAEEEIAEESTILSLAADTITTIYFKNENTEMTLEKGGESKWSYKEDTSLPVNQTLVGNMTSALDSVTSSRTITDYADLSSFGLDIPSILVKATLENGSVTTISIGDEAPVTGGYYATVNEGNEVYIITSGFTSYFKYDLVKLTEIESIPNISAENITHLTVENKGKTSFEAVYNENKSVDYAGMTNWTIKQPYETEIPGDEEALTSLMSNYSGLTYLANIDYNATDLSKYGLDEPTSTITIDYYEVITEETSETNTEEAETITTTNEYTFELLVGGTDSDGNYYVKTKDSKAVHTMSAETIAKLTEIDAYNHTYKYINLVNIDSLGTIDAVINGVKYTMEVKKTKDTVDEEETEVTKYYFNGNVVEEDNFKTLYQSIISPKTQREIPSDYVMNEQTTPVMSLIFNQNATGRTITVEYLPYDESYYIAKNDGVAYFLTDMRVINEMIEGLKNFQK